MGKYFCRACAAVLMVGALADKAPAEDVVLLALALGFLAVGELVGIGAILADIASTLKGDD